LVEREAKDQIKERKIRCQFLPPSEYDVEYDTARTKEDETEVPTPSRPQTSVRFDLSAQKDGKDQANLSSTATTTKEVPSAEEIATLRRELEQTRESLHTLQSSYEKLLRESNVVSLIQKFVIIIIIIIIIIITNISYMCI
jgi:hypothetical protein